MTRVIPGDQNPLLDHFAALPWDIQSSILQLADAVADASEAGQLRESRKFINDLSRLEQIPAPVRPLLKVLGGVASAVLLEAHQGRLDWARLEGFTGFNAYLAAMGHPEAGGPGEGGEEDKSTPPT